VFPAPAGMNRPLQNQPSSIPCVPRARGDEPEHWMGIKPTKKCSPRPRG